MSAGFEVDLSAGRIKCRSPEHRDAPFYRGCGSSSVFMFSANDFPRDASRDATERSGFWVATFAHNIVPEHLTQAGVPTTTLTLPVVAWVRGHSDNLSQEQGSRIGRIAREGEDLTANLRRRFGLN